MEPPARSNRAAVLAVLTGAVWLLAVAAVIAHGALAAPAAAGAAAAPAYVQGELIVDEVGLPPRVVELPAGTTLPEGLRDLRQDPAVQHVEPNYVATASFAPNDPGTAGEPGGWTADQPNLLGPESEPSPAPFGIDAPRAWDRLLEVGRAGGKGVRVAVVDTGIAYRDKGKRFRRSPDLGRARFVRGHDFVGDDAVPLDANGHGTHVASTIGENTDNGKGVAGVAYRAKLQPVRVLNGAGRGTAFDVARGINWASKHGADVINLSLEFPACAAGARGTTACVDRCADIRVVCQAVRKAVDRGALVVAAAGNMGGSKLTYPARINRAGVLAVGASDAEGQPAVYSQGGPPSGAALDLVAPGGSAPLGQSEAVACVRAPTTDAIVQMSFRPRQPKRFCLQRRTGTSMAAAHAAGVAALVIAKGDLPSAGGGKPAPAAVEQQLICSARDIGDDPALGAGLLDAAAATAAACAS